MAFNRIAAFAAACLLSCAAEATAEFKSQPPDDLREHIAALREADAVVGHEARCAAHPDLPGNMWRVGAARARCTLLREPKFSLEQITAMLDAPDGVARLEREFAALLEAHYTDPSQREQIHRALVVFDETPLARAVSDRWLAAAPDSAFALAASAAHYEYFGWHARGETLMSKVSAENQELMANAMTTAVPLYARALERNPRLAPACIGLMAIGRQMSAELEAQVAPVCVAIDPDSYYLAWERIRAAQPRWGGSREALVDAVAYAEARVERNPILGALLAEAVGDAAVYHSSLSPDALVEQLAAVSKMAPSGTLIAQAGGKYAARGDHWQALLHLSQGLRFWPLDDDWRARRARVLMALGDHAWAGRDLQVALDIDDSDGWRHYNMAWIQKRTGRGYAAMRPHLERALDDPRSRRAAYYDLCNGYLVEHDLKTADGCSRGLVAEYPEFGEGWFMREWVLTRTGGDGLQEARRGLLEHGDRSEKRHAARMQELDSMSGE